MDFFAINLRYLRKKEGLSQQELSDKIGGLKNTVSNYENGKSYPSYAKLFKIMQFFRVTSDDLLFSNLSAGKIEQSNLVSKEETLDMERALKILQKNDAINSKEINAHKKKIYELSLQLGSLKEMIRELNKGKKQGSGKSNS